MRVNKAMREQSPRTCPLIEVDGDSKECGTCCFHMPDGKTCPRHGDITPYLEEGKKEGESV
ncbi:MAG: hypothetical protein GWN55_16020 [Phycisphaerae bacterium]|nr:hypothetical protein [Phycisphaerae bacterium]NIX00478.1 hypothetical protein [Phycisphaerae bacterium]